jgi:hypothetical protein
LKPEITALEYPIIEIYNLCSNARDPMSGQIQYSIILDVAKSKGFQEFDDLLFYVDTMESLLNKKREANKPKNKK